MVYKLKSGLDILIDSADLKLVSGLGWSFDGKYVVNVKRYGPRKEGKQCKTYLHRFLMGLQPGDEGVIDHIDRDTLNNQRSNLRIVTQLENAHNKGLLGRNTSGYPGVYWFKPTQQWVAYLTYKGKKHSKYAKTKEDAIELRQQLKTELVV